MSAFEYEDITNPYYLRPNAVPWASVAPTIIFQQSNPWLAIGSPGSERIVSTIAQVVMRLAGQSPFDAVSAPRMHCSFDGKVSLETAFFRNDIPPFLEKHGFKVDIREPFSFYLGCIQLVLNDEGAAEIYLPLKNKVKVLVTTDVARAIVDMNRAEDDRRKDGVVKTHTCWDVPIYSEPLSDILMETLLAQYYRPYHQDLFRLADNVVAGIDCHTMAAVGPPVGPDPGLERPAACLSNADGTCPFGGSDPCRKSWN